ncbi:MAG: flagellar basal body-associated FliL family protein [Pseudomonadota bacterium]
MAKPEKGKKEIEAVEEAEAEASEEAKGEEGEQAEGEKEKKRLPGKKLILFYALPAVLAISIGAALAIILFDGPLSGGEAGSEKIAEKTAGESEPLKPAVFYEVPEILVNLNAKGRKASYLKISVSLELESSNDIPQIEAVLPRIVDKFQVYLRELRVEDLSGSAGMYRLREELLRRVVIAAEPAKVKDILFKEMLIQ